MTMPRTTLSGQLLRVQGMVLRTTAVLCEHLLSILGLVLALPEIICLDIFSVSKTRAIWIDNYPASTECTDHT